jgi:hypothetical protein
MKASSLAAFAAIAAWAVPAQADWYAVAKGTNGTVWYLDPARIKAVSGKVQVWAKLDASEDASVKWRETKELISIDCTANTSRVLSDIEYDSYGKIISSRNATDYGYGIGYDPIVPDTVLEAVS